jgi:L-glutamine-phosphate cytidylyltransferase
VRAIILAAGRGSRMRNLTEQRPKCLVELRGKALLDWQLAALREAGIDRVAIVSGYRRELIPDRGLVEFHNPRWAETNMVSSLACAQEWLQAETSIVSYSDIFYTSQAVKLLMENQAALAVTYDPNWLKMWKERFGDPLLDAETFRVNLDLTLAEIGKKPNSVEEVQGQYMGLLRVTPVGWAEFLRNWVQLPRAEQDRMDMTGMLGDIIDAKRIAIDAIPYTDEWGEIDSVEDLAVYNSKSG